VLALDRGRDARSERQFRRITGYPNLPALALTVERDIACHAIIDTPAPEVAASAV